MVLNCPPWQCRICTWTHKANTRSASLYCCCWCEKVDYIKGKKAALKGYDNYKRSGGYQYEHDGWVQVRADGRLRDRDHGRGTQGDAQDGWTHSGGPNADTPPGTTLVKSIEELKRMLPGVNITVQAPGDVDDYSPGGAEPMALDAPIPPPPLPPPPNEEELQKRLQSVRSKIATANNGLSAHKQRIEEQEQILVQLQSQTAEMEDSMAKLEEQKAALIRDLATVSGAFANTPPPGPHAAPAGAPIQPNAAQPPSMELAALDEFLNCFDDASTGYDDSQPMADLARALAFRVRKARSLSSLKRPPPAAAAGGDDGPEAKGFADDDIAMVDGALGDELHSGVAPGSSSGEVPLPGTAKFQKCG